MYVWSLMAIIGLDDHGYQCHQSKSSLLLHFILDCIYPNMA
jgi:hypothetical protein